MESKLLNEILNLSDYSRKSFGDKNLLTLVKDSDELSKLLSDNTLFETIALNFDVCPKCKKVFLSTKNGFCGACGSQFLNNKINHYKITLNKSRVIEIMKQKIIENLSDWKQLKSESNFLQLTYENKSILIYISMESCSLRDYYTIKGWMERNANSIFVMVSHYFEKDLEINALKNQEIQLFSFDKILVYQDELNKRIQVALDSINEDKRVAELIGGSFEEELDIIELRSRIETTLSNLDNYALHKNELSPQENGRKYQRAIIELLNQTLLPIKVLIKQDIQDVLIRVPVNVNHAENKVRWVPLEIKSYGITKKNQGKFNIREYCSQYRKYIEGHINNPSVCSVIDVKCFVIVAKDFLMDEDNINAIEEIEHSYNDKIHITLLPQNTIIDLMKRKYDQKNPIIDWDLVIDLFNKNRYLTAKDIDNFYSKIDEEFEKSPESTAIKNIQDKVHRQGK